VVDDENDSAARAATGPHRMRTEHLDVEVVGFGARLHAVRTPDRDGTWGHVLLGLADEEDYRTDEAHLGGCVGRFANRIAGGRFVLDGVAHEVPTNEPGVALHGGPGGFDSHPWERVSAGPDAITLRRTSPDGENGFPGTLVVEVTYSVDGPDLTIAFTATTDAPTVVNLTNHGYWNLAGSGAVEGHEVVLHADRYLPVDEQLIPTGELADVAGTPFDLREPVRIGARLRGAHPQLLRTRGYDHTFVLGDGPGLRPAARVTEPGSGRSLEVSTDQPGVQFYSGNMLDGTIVLRDGTTARQGDAFCLEAQGFPDAPNQPGFPSTVLRPGEQYRAVTRLRFGVVPPGS
jgi:aldose 1-epimerase